MAYKRVEFYTKRGKKVSFRARVKVRVKARVHASVKRGKVHAKRVATTRKRVHTKGSGVGPVFSSW